jgi:hypothetical protein
MHDDKNVKIFNVQAGCAIMHCSSLKKEIRKGTVCVWFNHTISHHKHQASISINKHQQASIGIKINKHQVASSSIK